MEINAGGGLNPGTGVFTCPVGGTYMFIIHLATHKDKVTSFRSTSVIFLSSESTVVTEKEWGGHGQYCESRW